MYLVLFLLGLIIGRNLGEIWKRTYEDTCKALQKLSTSKVAAAGAYMVEGAYIGLESRLHSRPLQCPHDLLHECDKRGCKPVKIDTWTRKLKAYN